MLPKAGGQYVFFREAYGSLPGFLFGWAMLLVIQTGTIAAVAAAFARFLAVLAPAVSDTPWAALGPFALTPQRLIALGVVVLLTATNVTGLRAGTLTQNVFTAAKLAALLALALGGLLLGTADAWKPPEDAFSRALSESRSTFGFALAAAAAMVGPFFSQSAWNNVTFAAEEVRDPGRTLPRALVIGCLIVTVTYVLTNVAYLRTLGFVGVAAAPQDRVGTAAAQVLFGPAGARAMAAAIMISTFGCVNGLVLSGARVSFAMARDGHFFAAFARLNRAAVPAQRPLAAGRVGVSARSVGNLQPAPEVRRLGGSAPLRPARPGRARAPPTPAGAAAAVSRSRLSVAAGRLCRVRPRPDRSSADRRPAVDVAGIRDPGLRRAGLLPLAPREDVVTAPASSTFARARCSSSSRT